MTPDTTDGASDVFEFPTKAAGVVTRDTGDGEEDLIRVPISSTRSDREGDRFAKDALEDMADQIRDEQPMVFDNHGLAGGWMDAIPYDARETIGAQVDAELEEDGDGESTLYALVSPDGTHPEGERVMKQVRDEGQPVKFSVGFGINEADAIEDEAGNEVGREFLSADLMETSRVGIPANPDASVTQASAKDADANLPGYRMHPMFRAMMGADGEAPTAAAKSGTPVTDGGDDLHDEVAELSAAVGELRAELDDLKDGGCGCGGTRSETREGEPCDDNGDCPEGEECVDGECVPKDDDGDGDEDEDSTDPDDTDATDAELRQRIAEIEAQLDGGTGESQTKDPTTEEPDLTDTEGEPDATNDAEPDHETIL